MKRLLCILLVAVMILSCFSAFADDTFDKQIQFRGAEWGSSFQNVKKVLPDGVRMNDLRVQEYWYPMQDMMYQNMNWNNQYKAEMGAYTYARSSSLEGVKVAGYEVTDLYLYFMYTPNDNGILVKDDDHTALICAYYKLEPKDVDAVYSDIVNKLTSLYGDVDVEDKDESLINYEENLWYGADETMVSVVKEVYTTSSSQYIYIKYGFMGGDKLMEQAYAAVVKEESEGVASNFEGL